MANTHLVVPSEPSSARRAFTLVEITLVLLIIAAVAAIGIPSLVRSRVNANESAAIGNLRPLASALETYKAATTAYPGSATGWQAAMYGASCAPGVPPDPDYGPAYFCVSLNESTVQGYAYTYTAGAASQAATYTITAAPAAFGITGSRAFFVDETTIIRHCLGASGATAASQPVGEPPAACP